MAKRESLKINLRNLENNQALPPLEEFPKSSKIAGAASRLFGIAKFILGLCLLPFAYSCTVSFLREFSLLDKSMQDYFWSGIISLIIIYLFVWEPSKIYIKGYRILEFVFSFFKPLVRVAPYVLPIYAIVLFILYWIISSFARGLVNYFMFLFGLSMALHLIFSAKSMRSRKGDFLKANYIFGFSLVYLINLMLVALCLNLLFEKYSFVDFFNRSFLIAKDIFDVVFKQLFLS